MYRLSTSGRDAGGDAPTQPPRGATIKEEQSTSVKRDKAAKNEHRFQGLSLAPGEDDTGQATSTSSSRTTTTFATATTNPTSAGCVGSTASSKRSSRLSLAAAVDSSLISDVQGRPGAHPLPLRMPPPSQSQSQGFDLEQQSSGGGRTHENNNNNNIAVNRQSGQNASTPPRTDSTSNPIISARVVDEEELEDRRALEARLRAEYRREAQDIARAAHDLILQDAVRAEIVVAEEEGQGQQQQQQQQQRGVEEDSRTTVGGGRRDDTKLDGRNDNERDRLRKRRRMLLYCGLVLLIVLVGVAVGMVIALSSRNNTDKQNKDGLGGESTTPAGPVSNNPTSAPAGGMTNSPTNTPRTAEPTSNPTQQPGRLANLQSLFLPVSGTSVFNSITFQFRALQILDEDDRLWEVYDEDVLFSQSPSSSISRSNVNIIEDAAFAGLLEYYVMTVFWAATGGETRWNQAFNFFGTINVCDWHAGFVDNGVRCNGGPRIQELAMPGNGLDGPLIGELGYLLQLNLLRLDYNSLYGSFPTEIGLLTQLRQVFVVNNALSGTLPTEFASIPTLEEVELFGNDMTGDIPSFKNNNGNLRTLDLDGNRFTADMTALFGSLPPESFEEFWCEGCRFHGEHLPGPELGRLTNLEGLFLPFTDIGGSIPYEIGSATALKYLNFGHNSITGPIPSTISNLSNLERLDLTSNVLSSKIPSLDGADNLQDFNVNFNIDLTGNITELVESVSSKIEYFACSGITLSGTIPGNEVARLTALVSFDVTETGIHGTIPSEFGAIEPLSHLVLNKNFLTGPIPPGFASHPGWVDFGLFDNLLTGVIPILAGAEYLQIFDVEINNGLTGNLTEILLPLSTTTLESFWVADNAVTGSIPTEIASFGALNYFGIYDNSIDGTIPSEMGLLTFLKQILLHGNLLDGTVPSELAELPALIILTLHNNDLTGDLTPSFCPRQLSELTSDCTPPNPQLACSCCTGCFQ